VQDTIVLYNRFPDTTHNKQNMIYFENAARGEEGFNTHLMSYTFCISFSNFLDRPFYLEYEIPCSTPPDYASRDEYRDKFAVLLNSERSIVSQLVDMPVNRVFEIDRTPENKAEYQLLHSYFATTEEMRAKFGHTAIWDFFGFGRTALTREDLMGYDLIEWTHSNLAHPSCFYFLPRADKLELLRQARIKFIEPIEKLASAIIDQFGQYYAVHTRLGDFLSNYSPDEYSVNKDRYTKYIAATFPDRSLPVLIATDALYEKPMFAEIFEGYKTIFIDEMIFEDFRDGYHALPFTDFNALTILNQLICAAADTFIGTYRSTFTSIIHRLRQERHNKKDFNYFPDNRVATLLGPDMKITKDRSGFFDWNRYSVFIEDHVALSWKREWDFDYTSIG